MWTKKINFITIIIILVFNFQNTRLYSQFENYKKNDLILNIKTSYSSGGAFFDSNGELISELTDSIAGNNKKYTFETGIFNFNLNTEYCLSNNFRFGLEIPFSVKSHKEKYSIDTNGEKKLKSEITKIGIESFLFNSKYKYNTTNFQISLNLDLRIPMGFKTEYDTNHIELYGFGPYSLNTGISILYDLDEYFIGGGILHYLRDKPYSNLMNYNLMLGLKSVKDIYLGTKIDYVNYYDGAKSKISIRQYQLNEEYLSLGFFFYLNVNSNISTDLSYKVKIFGKNTMSINDFNMQFSIIF